MNIVQRCIARVRQKTGVPLAALIAALLVLRGGVALEDELAADGDDWHREHGEPTWENLAAWAATLDMEAGIAAVALRQHAAKATPSPPA